LYVLDGCCKKKFDTKYPTELTGIINEGEFVEAIEKLNRTIFSNRVKQAIIFQYLLSFVISIIFIIKGGSWVKNVGLILFIFEPIFVFIFLFSIQYRQGKQMRAVVAGESKKYSTRSPIPCSWRLETTWIFIGCGNANDEASYRVSITTLSRIKEFCSNVYFIGNY
jgi:ACR3 family arsenite efflux pump ArsB